MPNRLRTYNAPQTESKVKVERLQYIAMSSSAKSAVTAIIKMLMHEHLDASST